MEVVSASHGVLGPLLGKLTDLLADECGRLKGVRREIRSLRAELTGMHGALKKYTKLEDPDDQVKAWISLVRELAYDTEDCFDKFIHHLGKSEHHGGFKEFCRKMSRRLKTLGARRGIANQIDDLKVRIKEVKELKSSYKLDDNACSTSVHVAVDPRLSALFAEEAHLVGIDGPRDDLAKWMLQEENKSHRRVLSVVGFGGLGKTTLANEVYRKVQGHFHCRAFISVSQKPDVKKIIKDVISQVPLGPVAVAGRRSRRLSPARPARFPRALRRRRDAATPVGPRRRPPSCAHRRAPWSLAGTGPHRAAKRHHRAPLDGDAREPHAPPARGARRRRSSPPPRRALAPPPRLARPPPPFAR